MSGAEIVDLSKKHSFFSWSVQGAVNPIPMVRAKGVYFWDADGKRYMDMNSQLMCVNIGHGDQRVIDAIKAQADELVYVGPGMATRVRAELGQMLAEVTPGDLDTFFFTLGGAEANENAIRMAAAFTGRHKIVTRYRAYHGATAGAIALTGDPRRWANEPGYPGRHAHASTPTSTAATSTWRATATPCSRRSAWTSWRRPSCTRARRRWRPSSSRPVTGTNGMIVPPDGYMQGLRELCDKYGILLICDEVMAGLGRTGEWFAVDHWGVVPDIITMAKGLTSAYLPLGAVAMSHEDRRASTRTACIYGGLTYSAHPMCLAAAVATLKVLHEDDLVGNSRRMGAVMAGLMADLKAKHPSVGDVRSIGLFGIVELVRNRQTKEPMAPFNGTSPEMQKLGAFFKENGLYVFVQLEQLLHQPAACVTEEELRAAFEIFDAAWISPTRP